MAAHVLSESKCADLQAGIQRSVRQKQLTTNGVLCAVWFNKHLHALYAVHTPKICCHPDCTGCVLLNQPIWSNGHQCKAWRSNCIHDWTIIVQVHASVPCVSTLGNVIMSNCTALFTPLTLRQTIVTAPHWVTKTMSDLIFSVTFWSSTLDQPALIWIFG